MRAPGPLVLCQLCNVGWQEGRAAPTGANGARTAEQRPCYHAFPPAARRKSTDYPLGLSHTYYKQLFDGQQCVCFRVQFPQAYSLRASCSDTAVTGTNLWCDGVADVVGVSNCWGCSQMCITVVVAACALGSWPQLHSLLHRLASLLVDQEGCLPALPPLCVLSCHTLSCCLNGKICSRGNAGPGSDSFILPSCSGPEVNSCEEAWTRPGGCGDKLWDLVRT